MAMRSPRPIDVDEGSGIGLITIVLKRESYPGPVSHELAVSLSAVADGFALGDPSSIATTFSFVPDTVVTLSGPEPAATTDIAGASISLVYTYSADDLHGRALTGSIEVTAAVDGDTVTPAIDVNESSGIGLITIVLKRESYPAPGSHELAVSLSAVADGFALGETSSIATTFIFIALVDRDGNGLIEIDSLLMLHNMRHDLAGMSYKTSTASVGDTSGCPDSGGCIGYELTRNLDFDSEGDESIWSRNNEGIYTLDEDDRNDDYFPVNGDAGGWQPIGNLDDPFVAEFDGNGHTISNLAIRSDTTYIGLFGVIGEGAAIRNLGLVDNLADYTGSSSSSIYIGGLVGYQGSGSSITASYAMGDADGGDGDNDYVGGLVGYQGGSSLITASYATGDVDGGDGSDYVGGLVGYQEGGGSSIMASYATGDADGGADGSDSVGGLVGSQLGGSITASYATGDADGGDGSTDTVGGLVGYQEGGGSITASYATGDADGGVGSFDSVGGLVGLQVSGSITASYATGDADGGAEDRDSVGGLVGVQYGTDTITASYGFGEVKVRMAMGVTDTITASYGFGEVMGVGGSDGSAKPKGVIIAEQLTADNAGAAWGSADSNTLGAWDFGTDKQIPALNYADYDGDTGDVFDCSQFPAGACDTHTLLPWPARRRQPRRCPRQWRRRPRR